jgi:hypothetical protein
MTSVNADELENAMILVDDPGSGEAWVCPATGKVYVRSDVVGELEPLPDDIDEEGRYIPVPGQRSLDLGQALVLNFVRQHSPADEDEVRQLFRRAGAYGRFSALLDKRGLRDRWHAFREEQTLEAMRAWCEGHGLALSPG